MKKPNSNLPVRLLKAFALLIAGAVIMLVVVGINLLNNKPDLKVWHTANLDAEFTTKSPINTFEEYLKLEETLFAQLDERVYDNIDSSDRVQTNRFHRGSLADPSNPSTNWNRSFELASPSTDSSKSAVLLLHGLSDSPYSLRSIGEQLHSEGAHVLGLRIPGHGTAPTALTESSWEDMAAAVEIAARYLHETSPNRPLHIIGYSNGGALAVHYALSSIENSKLPVPSGIVLISPEIGVTRMAAFAIWQERIGNLLGLQKLAWTGVVPEYDPYKYNSFPANAGALAYELTGINRATIARFSAEKKLAEFPPVLAFQSALDDTVTAPSLVNDLLDWLPENGHKLVVFDLNRNVEIEHLLKRDPNHQRTKLLDNPDRPYVLTSLKNADDRSDRIVSLTWNPGQPVPTKAETGLSWPKRIYSLSHVALPFPENDPVYGGVPVGGGPGIHLGNVAMRGEKNALQISAQDMLRLRWNPFHDYLQTQISRHLGMGNH